VTRAQRLLAGRGLCRGSVALAAIVLALAGVIAHGFALTTPTALASGSSPGVFVNEIHYDNAGEDVREGIELAGPAGIDLSPYSLELYNGFDQTRYATVTLTGELPDQENGYGTKFFPIPGLQNGAPDGIALVGPGGVEETLGYEGTFTAIDGSAAGLVLADIKQFEAPSTPVGRSLQLQGSGSSAADFTWSEPIGATPDEVNEGQSFVASQTAAPLNTQAPSISGAGNVGEAQHCSTGSWDGNPSSYSYEWSVNGSPIGVYSDTHTLESWPSGSTLTCTVTASNSAGSASAESAAVEVQPSPPPAQTPASTEAPSISGFPTVEETLSCSSGAWENGPTTYLYQWTRDSAPILDASSAGYAVQQADQGHLLACTVTASNSAGSASAESATTAVQAAPHSVTGADGEGVSNRQPAPPRTSEQSVLPPPMTAEPFAQLSEVGPPAASIVYSLAALLTTGWSQPMVRHLSLHGAHSIWFTAPSAGAISVLWAGAGTPASRVGTATTLAHGDSTFLSGVRGRLRLRLTAAGRKRLSRRRSLLVTEIATFTPSVGSAQTLQTQILILSR
jgi:hypothetical protein